MCRRLSLLLCSVCAGLRKPVHALARLSSKVQLTFLKLFIFKGIYLIHQLNTSFLHLFFFFNIYLAALGCGTWDLQSSLRPGALDL